MYSASVVDIAVIVCILEAQVMGAPAKRTSQPDLDLDVMGQRGCRIFASCRRSRHPPNIQIAKYH